MRSKLLIGIFLIIAAIGLTACTGEKDEKAENNNKNSEQTDDVSEQNSQEMNMDHTNMNHSGTSELPEGLKKAENPKFPVGTKVMIQANHMAGMAGAKGEVIGAYDTTVYSVSYTPVHGGQKVTNHKWVIHEEIEGAGEQPFKQGDQVTLSANHMVGMQGATATIDTAEKTTVYMVDYTDAITGEKVMNHKWVTESELSSP